MNFLLEREGSYLNISNTMPSFMASFPVVSCDVWCRSDMHDSLKNEVLQCIYE
jgi:hypothetical protein